MFPKGEQTLIVLGGVDSQAGFDRVKKPQVRIESIMIMSIWLWHRSRCPWV